jgi:hypothetical protein
MKTILSNIKKRVIFFSIFVFRTCFLFCQEQVYDNFEGTKSLHYGERSGVLDTLAKNPSSDNVNSSKNCALYIRNAGKKFDNIKMSLDGKLSDVSTYAVYTGIPPKLKMKIYTTAPAGTLIEILLGSKGRNNEYPAGTNSQYQAYTTVSNKWEEVQFKFSQIPQGSETSTTEIDQITLLFNPNTSNSDSYYFDEITGPLLVPGKLESGGSQVSFPKNGNKK